MTVKDMSNLLGPKSRTTVYKYMKKYNVATKKQRFSQINDDDLLRLIKKLTIDYPNAGYREIRSRLEIQHNVNVPFNRVMKLLRDADPIGSACCWARTIHRRTYSVEGPNSLWHLDTNHALRR